ncbi:hypothetical protein [Dongshaea marina]|uniref:hypothetical protein n=1 Tax=Dongshaea marina TaxID=2047966 RepID=UPI000D3E8A27|nr:hypothetical protein [Dongshaea marina]
MFIAPGCKAQDIRFDSGAGDHKVWLSSDNHQFRYLVAISDQDQQKFSGKIKEVAAGFNFQNAPPPRSLPIQYIGNIIKFEAKHIMTIVQP